MNKGEPIHRWYSYLEGYSSCLIEDVVMEIGPDNISAIYDPFCGTGTTALVASAHGIKSYYCETNPFMQTVIEAKINAVKRLHDTGVGSIHLREFLKRLETITYHAMPDEVEWSGFEKYFDPEPLSQLLMLKSEIETIEDDDSRSIAKVLLASVTVRASRMIRQGDLRFAKPGEKTDGDRAVYANFVQKLKMAIEDVDSNSCETIAQTTRLDDDARNISAENLIDCVITSPPYLNGTNYIRNTKLELKLSGFVDSERDLPEFHSKGIIAGINNVSKRTTGFEAPAVAQPYIEALEPVAYNKRIPVMVAGYFHDMEKVIEKLACAMKNGGYFIMDIGDSQFAGVHIPTHEILAKICEANGFIMYSEDVLRERRSKNGMVLSQRLMKFRLHKNDSQSETYYAQAKKFIEEMPYKQPPFSGRNWGHPWHSLCSYHGKLKPAIAHFLVEQFTSTGDVVVDPLSGVGTISLEACLQGRIGIGNDLSELAYTVTKAKVEKSDIDQCREVLRLVADYIIANKDTAAISELASSYEKFGYNGKLPNYFHPDTFKEILCARQYFVRKLERMLSAEAMVFSCFLHVLHGNRPYALSRNSHPLTPYAPTGDFIYKNVIEYISDKLEASYKKGGFDRYRPGEAIYGDYNDICQKGIKADAVICSPPFVDSIRFYMQNWMRLWLCGWEEDNYKHPQQGL